MSYKWCAVPACTNTTIKTPKKLFITVPKNVKIRKTWLQLARRDPREIKSSSVIFFCQDHFDLDKDMANYYQYNMGLSQKIIMINGAVPTKFYCQQDCRKRMIDASTSRPVKRQRQQLIQECKDSLIQEVLSKANSSITQPTVKAVQDVLIVAESQLLQNKSTSTEPIITTEKSTQFNFKEKVYFRSKSIQTKALLTTSPFKHCVTSRCTSPFKTDSSGAVMKPSCLAKTYINNIEFIDVERSESNALFYPDAPKQDIDTIQRLNHSLYLIYKKPMMYIGVSKDFFFIVDLIHKHTNILHEHILLCLKKIRLNNTCSELEDNFGLSSAFANTLFFNNIPIIASVLRPFIVNLEKQSIKKTLPTQFQDNRYNVFCVIDCLEIEIQKPLNPVFQVQTWSEYKKSNTVKFLISCTPNGLINYVSPGFGGRASEVTILQNCNFFDNLEPDNFVLTHRGFKNVKYILGAKGIKMLQPPNVASVSKLSKSELQQTKIIASLRKHIEKVIRRVREFHMLKQYNKKFFRVLDDVVIIACALINLQNSVINRKTEG